MDDSAGQTYLVTNWHVLTNRRPDSPGRLLGGAGESPISVEVDVLSGSPGEETLRFGHYRLPLYGNDGSALWIQSKVGSEIDIAALPIELDDTAEALPIQRYSTFCEHVIEPGYDLTIVGFPFENADDLPFPIWKRSTVASEPRYRTFGIDQILLDGAGTPGMSGSPVFKTEVAYWKTAEEAEAEKTETIFSGNALSWITRERETRNLEFIGIYAGAVGDRRLEQLQLGRLFALPAIAQMLEERVAGSNPFPPAHGQR